MKVSILSWGTPSSHPVVTDDHDLVLKSPCWRQGFPHDKKKTSLKNLDLKETWKKRCSHCCSSKQWTPLQEPCFSILSILPPIPPTICFHLWSHCSFLAKFSHSNLSHGWWPLWKLRFLLWNAFQKSRHVCDLSTFITNRRHNQLPHSSLPPTPPPDFNLALSAPASDGAFTSGAMRTLMLVSALKTPAAVVEFKMEFGGSLENQYWNLMAVYIGPYIEGYKPNLGYNLT